MTRDWCAIVKHHHLTEDEARECMSKRRSESKAVRCICGHRDVAHIAGVCGVCDCSDFMREP